MDDCRARADGRPRCARSRMRKNAGRASTRPKAVTTGVKARVRISSASSNVISERTSYADRSAARDLYLRGAPRFAEPLDHRWIAMVEEAALPGVERCDGVHLVRGEREIEDV